MGLSEISGGLSEFPRILDTPALDIRVFANMDVYKYAQYLKQKHDFQQMVRICFWLGDRCTSPEANETSGSWLWGSSSTSERVEVE
jgi:hypothetical protein